MNCLGYYKICKEKGKAVIEILAGDLKHNLCLECARYFRDNEIMSKEDKKSLDNTIIIIESLRHLEVKS